MENQDRATKIDEGSLELCYMFFDADHKTHIDCRFLALKPLSISNIYRFS